MHIRQRLRFHALGRIDNQQRAFACRERSRNFVGKIDMSRRVEQIQPISFTRACPVTHHHRMRFDCDPALALQIHRIEKLILLFPLLNGPGALEQSIRQGRLAVVDVRDDAKIAR